MCIKDSQKHIISYLKAKAKPINSVSDLLVEIQPLWIQNVVIVEIHSSEKPSISDFVNGSIVSVFQRSIVLQFLMECFHRCFIFEVSWMLNTIKDLQDFIHLVVVIDRMDAQKTNLVGSNIRSFHAPEPWNFGVTGQHLTVPSIDSGVRYSQEALKNTFREKLR
ncbi:unnamed protein product [Albugo candida]|uniref:subtilisin n=1 Tax=Albugo candida TaxID=65357 RepID=A0A024G393_9STRA|nr:unnamed protein product [Albugo candida]|eukprot:CCI40779.1 unnamed protein product [Albugo candida]